MNQATYCPEDNKLRLYVGRVPRDEYEKLRAEGWTSTPKQDCDFVATWTPERRDTCLEYADLIEDEDQGLEDRAADRAERFAEYRDKRTDEANGHADRYDAGPAVHGYQSAARGERAARRHDRIADRAGDAWGKAEYWQRRTAGVISNALYKSTPGVRMGRIKVIESDIRKTEKSRSDYAAKFEAWTKCAALTDTDAQDVTATKLAYFEHGDYIHPRTGRKSYLYDHSQVEELRNADALTGAELCALWFSQNKPLAPKGPWLTHYRLRLAYENQMLDAQGGRAAFVEMEAGGFIGKHQIRKVNKSPATGRAVSVTLRMEGNRWGNAAKPGEYYTRVFNIERLPSDAYTPPTDADRAALDTKKKAEKAAAPKADPCPLVNPTDAEAEQLQAIWNASRSPSWGDAEKPIVRMTQAQYSALSKGSHTSAETKSLAAGGLAPRSCYGRWLEGAVCKVRFYGRSVVVLTDKAQKALPEGALISPRPAQLEIVQDQIEELQEIHKLLCGSMKDTGDLLTDEQRELFRLARLVGYAYYDSLSQRGLTAKAGDFIRAREQQNPVIAKMIGQSELFA